MAEELAEESRLSTLATLPSTGPSAKEILPPLRGEIADVIRKYAHVGHDHIPNANELADRILRLYPGERELPPRFIATLDNYSGPGRELFIEVFDRIDALAADLALLSKPTVAEK